MKKLSTALTSIALTLILNACSSNPKADTQNTNQPLRISVAIERSQADDSWTVTYQLNQSVSELVFDRQTNRFRSKNWISKTPGILIKEVDGQEMIVSENGARFDSVIFSLKSYYDETPKDYEFFQAFSDKSVVVYTGHFNACSKNQDCEEPIDFIFRGRSKDKIVILGQVNTREYRWTDKSGRGTYVYFGTIKPLERMHLTAIIDPTLPKWLEKRVYDMFPKLFDFYAKETGYSLTFKPLIFLNYVSEERDAPFHGGTLPGLIQLTLFGKGWAKEDRKSFISIAKFLAHESAHVWNGQLFPYASKDMWMHEGGANAFAYMALFKLEFIDRKEFLELQTGDFNHCVTNLKDRPLIEVTEDRNFRAHYSCGAMMALITHAAVKKNNKSYDLFQFWKAMFTKFRNQNLRFYTEDTYFSTLLDMTGDEVLVRNIQTFINGPTNSSSSFVKTELERLGIKFYSTEKNQIPLGIQAIPL